MIDLVGRLGNDLPVMRRNIFYIITGITLSMLSLPVRANAAGSSADEQALIKIQHEWADACLKRDHSFPQRIESDDFTVVWWDGTIANKEEDVKSITGDTVFSEFEIDDLKSAFTATRRSSLARDQSRRTRKTKTGAASTLDRYFCKTEWRIESGRFAGGACGEKIMRINRNCRS